MLNIIIRNCNDPFPKSALPERITPEQVYHISPTCITPDLLYFLLSLKVLWQVHIYTQIICYSVRNGVLFRTKLVIEQFVNLRIVKISNSVLVSLVSYNDLMILQAHCQRHRKAIPGNGIFLPGKIYLEVDILEANIRTRRQVNSHGPLLLFSFLGILLGISYWYLLQIFNNLQHVLHDLIKVSTQHVIL